MNQSGILLMDKPEGPSSAHLVQRVKTVLGAKKVGHLGSLDPFASGLLLLGVNEGTKIAQVFLDAAKSYRGVIVLGVATDSQDSTGNVVEVKPVPPIGDEELQALKQRFTGLLQQIPPMFSALKRAGVRLYRLARQGKDVPREPRSIRIEALALRKLDGAQIEFDVTCSRGTYVRTLAADMGSFLGCGAHLSTLRRLACGHLTVEKAIGIDELARLNSEQKAPLVSIPSALSHLRGIIWESRWIARLRLGQQEMLGQIGTPVGREKWLRILDPRGELAALVEWDEEMPGGRWRLFRVFHP
jgi:tRNA pseudouridine55 synthase